MQPINTEMLDLLDTATLEEEKQDVINVTVEDLPSVLESVKKNLLQRKATLDKKCELLVPIKEINNEIELKDARKTLMFVGKSIKEIAELRLNTTRPLDQFKKDIIEVERTICSNLQKEIDRVKKIGDDWEIAETKRKRAEQEMLQKDIEKKAELERLKVVLIAESVINLDRFINRVSRDLRDGFYNINLENFDEKIRQLNGYKPTLKDIIYNTFFEASYNTDLISISEYSQIKKEIQDQNPCTAYAEKYTSAINKVVDELKNSVPLKKKELEEIAELQKRNAEEAERKRKANAERLKVENEKRDAEQKAAEERQRELAAARAETASLKSQLDSQKDVQEVGPIHVKSRLVKAVVLVPSAYSKLLEFYIKNGGDQTKLDFLAVFASSHGMPEIQGIKYNM
jgi:hypothetical protein